MVRSQSVFHLSLNRLEERKMLNTQTSLMSIRRAGWLCIQTPMWAMAQWLSYQPRPVLVPVNKQKGYEQVGGTLTCAPKPTFKEQTPPARMPMEKPQRSRRYFWRWGRQKKRKKRKGREGKKLCCACSLSVIWSILSAGTVTLNVTNSQLLFHASLLSAWEESI